MSHIRWTYDVIHILFARLFPFYFSLTAIWAMCCYTSRWNKKTVFNCCRLCLRSMHTAFLLFVLLSFCWHRSLPFWDRVRTRQLTFSFFSVPLPFFSYVYIFFKVKAAATSSPAPQLRSSLTLQLKIVFGLEREKE